jgi:hypothetical protein
VRTRVTAASLVLLGLVTGCGDGGEVNAPEMRPAQPGSADVDAALSRGESVPFSGRIDGAFRDFVVLTRDPKQFLLLSADGKNLVSLDETTELNELNSVYVDSEADVAVVRGIAGAGGLSSGKSVFAMLDTSGKASNLIDADGYSYLSLDGGVLVLESLNTGTRYYDVATGEMLWEHLQDDDAGYRYNSSVVTDEAVVFQYFESSEEEGVTLLRYRYITHDLRTGARRGASTTDPTGTYDENGERVDANSVLHSFPDGTVLRKDEAGDGLGRSGTSQWNLDNIEFVAASDERVVVAGPTDDLVVLDAKTGVQLGEPIKTTATSIEGCGGQGSTFVTDSVVALQCRDETGQLLGL